MAQTCDSSFTKHRKAIIDNAVGGGIVCSLGEQSLRTFLTDIKITLKPQQDFIIEGLDKLKKTTEVAVAALEESGSPYKHTVVRNLRTHNAAYVTFTKVRFANIYCSVYSHCQFCCNSCVECARLWRTFYISQVDTHGFFLKRRQMILVLAICGGKVFGSDTHSRLFLGNRTIAIEQNRSSSRLGLSHGRASYATLL